MIASIYHFKKALNPQRLSTESFLGLRSIKKIPRQVTNDNAFLCGKSIHMSANALYCTLNVTITYSVPRLWSCNSNLLTCTFLLCNLLKRVHLCTQTYCSVFLLLCNLHIFEDFQAFNFNFLVLNLLSNFMKISQYRKRKKKFYSQKTWQSQMRYYTVMYSYVSRYIKYVHSQDFVWLHTLRS